SPLAPIRSWQRWTAVSPESAHTDDSWLDGLIARSPALANAALRRHWRRVLPWLPAAAREELADILLEIEQAGQTQGGGRGSAGRPRRGRGAGGRSAPRS